MNVMTATDMSSTDTLDDARVLYEAVKATRSAEYNRRIAAHEVGHAFIARALGTSVDFVTIVPSGGYAGRCVRRGAPSAQLNLLASTPAPTTEPTTQQVMDICTAIGAPMIGMARVEIAEEIMRAQVVVTELVAGRVAEKVFFPDHEPLPAEHDLLEARAFASVCASPGAAVDALLAYASADADTLIRAHLPVVTALIDQLVEHGTLSGEQVDEIISGALARFALAKEQARRRDFAQRVKSAAIFAAQNRE
jgi:hypothetical protein